ncbi:DNA helicase UvrD [Candidatus Micrarchaeota archaeon RBG_16_36_9]|nr:MAG: DNA helicase UvrD [Candidatus Micrarchaeota archaeon RBG_16_36_9]
MKLFADLHLHSHYSRATSNRMNIENLEKYAKVKGLNLLGTGDFTHPLWLDELKKSLTEDNGLFHFKDKDVSFILQAEVSSIYNDGETRKIHNVILAPSFEVVDQINDFLKNYGKLASDGRPILTKIDCAELVEKLINISKDIMIIPAHIWTPWFSLFGSKSGFDKIEECFKDQTKNIFALETGLSSNPQMNWRLSALDRFALVSNSDSHSPWPTRLGRELNVFETEMNYNGIINVIKEKNPKKFLYTVEVDPAYGKYHWDGHRNCNVSLEPKEAIKYNNICPVCGKPLTIGVLHRVEELADREEGFVPENSIPFKSLLPLSELISHVYNTQPFSKKVWEESMKLTNEFGSELNVLLNADEERLKLLINEKIVKIILDNREGRLKVQPGYDGVYGQIISSDENISKTQKKIDSYF